MEHISGNIFIRTPSDGMKAGEVVLGHMHHFDHTTLCLAGAIEVSLLRVTEAREDTLPLEAEVDCSVTLRAGDPEPWFLVMKGRYHMIRSLEDGSRYGCIYAHQMPQAITDAPGQQAQKPYTKRDDDGTLWVRVDERVVQDSMGWVEAYR